MSEAADVIQLHQLRSNSQRSVTSSHQGWIEVWNTDTPIILLVVETLLLQIITASPLERYICRIIVVIWLYKYCNISLLVCYTRGILWILAQSVISILIDLISFPSLLQRSIVHACVLSLMWATLSLLVDTANWESTIYGTPQQLQIR